MIPKVIHYCWFGHNPKPEIVEMCIDSWKKHCPDYELVEWNEENFDVNFCEYSRDAYKAEKWAFVSDIARIKVLYENGGVYLDTDVELKRSLDDWIEHSACFCSGDIRYFSTGLGFASCKNHGLLHKLLEERLKRAYDMTICDYIDTPIIREYLNIKQSRDSQLIDDVYLIGMNDYGKYAKHHYTGTWGNKRLPKQPLWFWKFKWKLRNPRFINWLERNGETKISKLFIFCVYDLLDNGPIYFVKRLVKRVFSKK